MSSEFHQGIVTTLKTNGRFEKVAYDSRGSRLLANIYRPENSHERELPGVFIVHGGGLRGKSTFKELQRQLRDRGMASFAYDTAGTGGSEGTRTQETLNSRLMDARASLEAFRKSVRLSKLGALGMSMGADIAVNLTNSEGIDSLALLSAAAYPDVLRDDSLQLGFTRQIRQQAYDWSRESVFSTLRVYADPVMALYGSEDRIIPADVQAQYREILEGGNPLNEFTLVDGATHNFLHAHTTAEARAREEIIAHVARFSAIHLSPDNASN